MKLTYYCLLLLSCCPLFLFGQYYKTAYKIEPIKKQYRFYLNSKTNLGGKTRTYVKIDLPPNTVQWYFAFTTHPSKQDDRILDIGTQLATYASGGDLMVKLSGELIKGLLKPPGLGLVDIYLTGEEGQRQFMEKNGLGIWAYSKPQYYREGLHENAKDGTALIDDVTRGSVFLCFRNPSLREGTLITLEISAVVAYKVYVDEWTTESRQALQQECQQQFAYANDAVQDICHCCTQTLTKAHLPSTYQKLTPQERSTWYKEHKTQCSEQTGHTQTLSQQERLHDLKEEVQGLRHLNDYPALLQRYQEMLALGMDDASVYNSIGWYALLTRNWEVAKIHLSKGLGKAPDDLYLQGNLAHYFLLTNQYKSAETIYWKYRHKRIKRGLTWKRMVRADFELFEQLGLYCPDIDAIKKRLHIR